MTFDNYPIAAIATAPGRGGIGIVRISGADLKPFIHDFFQRTLQPRHAHFLPFNDANQIAIDEGIALYFPGPQSYTGEDILELQGHGGPAVLRRVLERCLEVGRPYQLRLAHPGEYTQRAFLNDRLDLAQAEAVADLIDASSSAAAKGAMASLSGAFSQEINQLAEQIIHLRMLVEATLDFPEEEIDFLEKYQAAEQLQSIQQQVNKIFLQAQQGQVLRDGLQVVLAGQPNVGKSSLLNALAGDEIAIVTDIAGTTRDRLSQTIHLDGVPIHIIDTAGLREAQDQVESIGIDRSWQEINKAHVIMHLLDARQPPSQTEEKLRAQFPQQTPVLTVYNKIDLLNDDEQAQLKKQAATSSIAQEQINSPNEGVADTSNSPLAGSNSPLAGADAAGVTKQLYISALTGEGLDDLRQTLLSLAGWSTSTESPWLARERHLQALKRCAHHLEQAAAHAQYDDQILDLFAEELRLAHTELGAITGQFSSDDLLGEIFSSFCIGK